MIHFIKTHKLLVAMWTLAILTVVGFGLFLKLQSNQKTTPPQTDTVSKTTLTQIVSASGQISSANQTTVTTSAGGKVTAVYVSVGSTVKKGDKLMEIDPDATTLQNQRTAWAAYLTAKNGLTQAKAKLYQLEAAKLGAEQKFNQDAVDKGLDTSDLTYRQLKAAMQAAQADYNGQSDVIKQAQAAADNAYASYAKTLGTVLAPASGTVQDLTFAVGDYVTASSSTGSASGDTGTAVAKLKVNQKQTATIKVSELDIAGVKTGQEVSLTLTALAGKTYHGKVVSVGSTGSTDSNNITTFAVTVELSDGGPEIMAGMAVSGDITTQVKQNVLAVSNQAITTSGDKHTVTVLKNGQQRTVTVTIGLVLDTQSEITAGLSEGDVVIAQSSSSSTSNDSTPSGPSVKGMR